MSKTPESIHPRFEEADIVIVDQEDVTEIWPALEPHQTMYSEDEYTEGGLEFNLIVGPDGHESIEEPGIATQIGYHALNGKSVLDLRKERGGWGDALYGLSTTEE